MNSDVQEYFYGLSNDLSPHSSIANFSDLQVFRIGGGPQAPRSALPIGAEPTADPTRVVPVGFSRDLLHVVLAVSFAKDPEHLLSRYISPLSSCLFLSFIILQTRSSASLDTIHWFYHFGGRTDKKEPVLVCAVMLLASSTSTRSTCKGYNLNCTY